MRAFLLLVCSVCCNLGAMDSKRESNVSPELRTAIDKLIEITFPAKLFSERQFPYRSSSGIVCNNQLEALVDDSWPYLYLTGSDCFVNMWWERTESSEVIQTQKDGCIIGCLLNKEPLTATCDSWLRMLISLEPHADVTFSADAVMFLNGEFGRHVYTHTFSNMLGTVEFTLPVAEGCHISMDFTCNSVDACFTLIPMSITPQYREKARKLFREQTDA